ncbi:MAG: CAP domain-containing protein [Pseudomonadota bacterium]|nr:CAP domain-containing protein [Pseudomonadota bacterium]
MNSKHLYAVFALALAVAACGGDDKSSGGGQAETISTGPTAPTSGGAGHEQALALVNSVRAQARKCGDQTFAAAPPLVWNQVLAQIAQAHSQDMATHDYFSHTGRDGSRPSQRAQAAGYNSTYIGENISAGRATMQAAMDGWLASPGHCANIMNPAYKDYGIGAGSSRTSRYGTYHTQVFGRR